MAIRTLIAKFIADTTQFEAGVKKASKSLTPFQQQLATIKSLGSSFRLLAGGAAFAGITLAANKVASALEGVNEELLAVAQHSKTGWEAVTDGVRNAAAGIPIIGRIAAALGNFARFDIRADISEATGMQAGADQATKQLAERADAKKAADAFLDSRRAVLQAMINMGREQAREQAIEQADFLDSRKKFLADYIALGRQQAHDSATQAFADELSELRAIVDRFADPMAEIEMQISKVNAAFQLGDLSIGEYQRSIAGLQKEMDELNKKQRITSTFFQRQPGRGAAEGQQISLSRTFIGGLSSASGGQTVMDPQLKETNRLLTAIERNFGRSGGATYAP